MYKMVISLPFVVSSKPTVECAGGKEAKIIYLQIEGMG